MYDFIFFTILHLGIPACDGGAVVYVNGWVTFYLFLGLAFYINTSVVLWLLNEILWNDFPF